MALNRFFHPVPILSPSPSTYFRFEEVPCVLSIVFPFFFSTPPIDLLFPRAIGPPTMKVSCVLSSSFQDPVPVFSFPPLVLVLVMIVLCSFFRSFCDMYPLDVLSLGPLPAPPFFPLPPRFTPLTVSYFLLTPLPSLLARLRCCCQPGASALFLFFSGIHHVPSHLFS